MVLSTLKKKENQGKIYGNIWKIIAFEFDHKNIDQFEKIIPKNFKDFKEKRLFIRWGVEK